MGLLYEETEEPQVQIQEKPKEPTLVLEKLDILHETILLFKDLKDNELLITRNIFTGKVKIKETGLRWKLPIIKKGFILDKGRYILEVKDPKSEDGRYSQDIGIGKDIKLTLNVRVEASDNPKYAAKLLRQQDTYVYAIRYASERVMRAIIADKYQINEKINNLDINELRGKIQKTFNLDMSDVINNTAPISQECSKEILKITNDLLVNYGIKLVDVHFPDVDLPKEITDMIDTSLRESNQRQIDKEKADTDVYIAKQEAEAAKSKRQAEIEMLKNLKTELGLSEEQVSQYLKWKAMPANAVAVLGDDRTKSAGYIAANMLNQNQNSEGEKSK